MENKQLKTADFGKDPNNHFMELTELEIISISGGDACTTAFELSYGVIGGAMGGIFGPGGAVVGFGAGYSFGSILAEGICNA